MQSSSQIVTTNKTTHNFLQARCPSCHPNHSLKALKERISYFAELLTTSSPGVFQPLSLTTNSSWLPCGRVAMPLISPLMSVPQSWVLLLLENKCIAHLFLNILLRRTEKSNKYRNGPEFDNDSRLSRRSGCDICQRPRSFKLQQRHALFYTATVVDDGVRTKAVTKCTVPVRPMPRNAVRLDSVVSGAENLHPSLYSAGAIQRGDLIVPRAATKFGDRAFAVSGPLMWNGLPTTVRNSSTLSSFKSASKSHLFT